MLVKEIFVVLYIIERRRVLIVSVTLMTASNALSHVEGKRGREGDVKKLGWRALERGTELWFRCLCLLSWKFEAEG